MMTVSEDYKIGFKDGFAAGLEEGKKTVDLPKHIGSLMCSICGRYLGDTSVSFVCYNSNCHTSYTAYSGKAKSPDETSWIIR